MMTSNTVNPQLFETDVLIVGYLLHQLSLLACLLSCMLSLIKTKDRKAFVGKKSWERVLRLGTILKPNPPNLPPKRP